MPNPNPQLWRNIVCILCCLTGLWGFIPLAQWLGKESIWYGPALLTGVFLAAGGGVAVFMIVGRWYFGDADD